MATKYTTTPLGIVELTRETFDHLASAGRIMVCRTGTPYCDISGDGEPCWVPCQITPQCICRRTGKLTALNLVCPVHGGES